jgi:hypothetical protein
MIVHNEIPLASGTSARQRGSDRSPAFKLSALLTAFPPPAPPPSATNYARANNSENYATVSYDMVTQTNVTPATLRGGFRRELRAGTMARSSRQTFDWPSATFRGRDVVSPRSHTADARRARAALPRSVQSLPTPSHNLQRSAVLHRGTSHKQRLRFILGRRCATRLHSTEARVNSFPVSPKSLALAGKWGGLVGSLCGVERRRSEHRRARPIANEKQIWQQDRELLSHAQQFSRLSMCWISR